MTDKKICAYSKCKKTLHRDGMSQRRWGRKKCCNNICASHHSREKVTEDFNPRVEAIIKKWLYHYKPVGG